MPRDGGLSLSRFPETFCRAQKDRAGKVYPRRFFVVASSLLLHRRLLVSTWIVASFVG